MTVLDSTGYPLGYVVRHAEGWEALLANHGSVGVYATEAEAEQAVRDYAQTEWRNKHGQQ